jgi:prepilin-type N-terminal cleavage/methylation domain-containing protein
VAKKSERESIMKTARKHNGFTVLEMLMSLVILAVLMTAVAVAFDASIVNFQANESISKTTNAGRAALLRMTTELRTAQWVGVKDVDDDIAQSCTLTTSSRVDVDGDGNGGDRVCYWFDNITDPAHPVLRYNIDGVPDDNDPVVCKNVVLVEFDRPSGSNPRNVRIKLTLTDDKGNNPQTLAAAAVVRRNL